MVNTFLNDTAKLDGMILIKCYHNLIKCHENVTIFVEKSRI